jgi:hypothetical protein
MPRRERLPKLGFTAESRRLRNASTTANATLDWTAGMDEENVTEFGWALQGEQVLHQNLVSVAEADLERTNLDPAKVFSDDWQLADADRKPGRLCSRRPRSVARRPRPRRRSLRR